MNTIEITVTGPAATGKSAALTMIERELRRQGFAFRYADPADIPAPDHPAETLESLSRSGHLFVLGGAAAAPAVSAPAVSAPVGPTYLADPANAPLGVGYSHDAGWHHLDAVPDVAGNRLFSRIITRVVDGQTVVAIPAFHYRTETGDTFFRLWLSAEAREGYRRHPAFMLDGKPIAEILIGAFEASGDTVAASVHGEKPMVSVTLDQMRAACAARGEGWGLWSIYELAAIQMLALVEFGHPDMQDAIGRGNVSGSGAAPGGSTSATWRGLRELWGNVWHWVDGLRISPSGHIQAWDQEGCREWVDTGIRSPLVDEGGWPADFHAEPEIDAILLPCALTDDRDDALVRDYHFGAWEGVESYPIHGGYWGHGANAGLFFLNLAYAASNSSPYIGGRLAKRVR